MANLYAFRRLQNVFIFVFIFVFKQSLLFFSVEKLFGQSEEVCLVVLVLAAHPSHEPGFTK